MVKSSVRYQKVVKSSVRYQKVVEIEIDMALCMSVPNFHKKFKDLVKEYLDTTQYATYHGDSNVGHKFIVQTYVGDSDIHNFIDAVEVMVEAAE